MNKTIYIFIALFTVFLSPRVGYSAVVFQDDFDIEVKGLKPYSVFGATSKEWYYYATTQAGVTRTLEQTGGRLVVKTNTAGGTALGDGIFYWVSSAPQLNFFRDVTGQSNSVQRVYSIRGIRFGQSDPTVPKHYHNFTFILSSIKGNPYAGTFFKTTLNGANGFTINGWQNYRNISVANLGVPVPITPNRMDVMLDNTNYKVTYYFQGGGLFFEGQHGLQQATWENAAGDNFYPILVGHSTNSGELPQAEYSIDSFVVTDGQP